MNQVDKCPLEQESWLCFLVTFTSLNAFSFTFWPVKQKNIRRWFDIRLWSTSTSHPRSLWLNTEEVYDVITPPVVGFMTFDLGSVEWNLQQSPLLRQVVQEVTQQHTGHKHEINVEKIKPQADDKPLEENILLLYFIHSRYKTSSDQRWHVFHNCLQLLIQQHN